MSTYIFTNLPSCISLTNFVFGFFCFSIFISYVSFFFPFVFSYFFICISYFSYILIFCFFWSIDSLICRYAYPCCFFKILCKCPGGNYDVMGILYFYVFINYDCPLILKANVKSFCINVFLFTCTAHILPY